MTSRRTLPLSVTWIRLTDETSVVISISEATVCCRSPSKPAIIFNRQGIRCAEAKQLTAGLWTNQVKTVIH